MCELASACEEDDCVVCMALSQNLLSKRVAFKALLEWLVHQRMNQFIGHNELRWKPCSTAHEVEISAALLRLTP